jgi:hypothetical protein
MDLICLSMNGLDLPKYEWTGFARIWLDWIWVSLSGLDSPKYEWIGFA